MVVVVVVVVVVVAVAAAAAGVVVIVTAVRVIVVVIVSGRLWGLGLVLVQVSITSLQKDVRTSEVLHAQTQGAGSILLKVMAIVMVSIRISMDHLWVIFCC